jgi:hypothetical protein
MGDSGEVTVTVTESLTTQDNHPSTRPLDLHAPLASPQIAGGISIVSHLAETGTTPDSKISIGEWKEASMRCLESIEIQRVVVTMDSSKGQ